jgi:hypothetical protein
VAVGDFNGDGHLDLAVTNSGSSTVSVLMNNGNGTFATKVDYTTGFGPHGVAVGDFNSDGHLDLAVVNDGANTVSVLLNNGNGTFATKTDFATGFTPIEETVGDFNGDGRPDLAVVNEGADTVSVLLNTTATSAPEITSANATSFTADTAGTFTVTATGSPTPALTETGTLPNGVTFTNNGNGTATLAGTPTVAGTFTLTLTAHNTSGTDATQTFTLTVIAGTLSITVPGTASIGSGAPGTSITGHLGSVQVTDNRGSATAAWTASVTTTSFTTGGATTPETVPIGDISYWSGPSTASYLPSTTGTFNPGQANAAAAQVLSSSRTAFTLTSGVGDNSLTWNPTLIAAVPAGAIGGTYTGTVTHSVA